MINVLHICNEYPFSGGLELLKIISKYSPLEFKHYAIAFRDLNGLFRPILEENNITCLDSTSEDYPNLEEVIKKYNINVCHKQTGGGDCPDYVYRLKKIGVPLIETIHCPRKSAIPLDHVNRITYTTYHTLEQNPEDYQKRMTSIQYAVDLEKPFYKIGEKKFFNKTPLIVGRMARIVPEKRHDVVLDIARMAWSLYREKIQFYIAGVINPEIEYSIEYGKNLIAEIDKIPNIHYLGKIDNKYDFYHSLDVCLHPIWGTSFDIPFLEAMACGIPILTYDNSAAKYVVRDAGIVTKESLDSLYNGLKTLYSDVSLREKLGNKGIEYINTIYNKDVWVNSNLDMYKEVLANKEY